MDKLFHVCLTVIQPVVSETATDNLLRMYWNAAQISDYAKGMDQTIAGYVQGRQAAGAPCHGRCHSKKKMHLKRLLASHP